jgi:hypothetical protein
MDDMYWENNNTEAYSTDPKFFCAINIGVAMIYTWRTSFLEDISDLTKENAYKGKRVRST